MSSKHVVSGGPLGGEELDFEPVKDGGIVTGVALGVVPEARKLARYELRNIEDEMGNLHEHIVFTGWVSP